MGFFCRLADAGPETEELKKNACSVVEADIFRVGERVLGRA